WIASATEAAQKRRLVRVTWSAPRVRKRSNSNDALNVAAPPAASTTSSSEAVKRAVPSTSRAYGGGGGAQSGNLPRFAYAAARRERSSRRDETPSLPKAWERCRSTVLTLMKSASAISRF